MDENVSRNEALTRVSSRQFTPDRLAGAASSTALAASTSDTSKALSDFRALIQLTETAAGFHSLEMPKLRDTSESVPITVDEECFRFAIVTGKRDKEICREHSEINKLVVVLLKDDWQLPGA